MKFITGIDNIREAQTVRYPTGDEIRACFPQYVKGYITAIYDRNREKWLHGYTATREEAVDHYDQMKRLAAAFPELYNWFEMSEMYIYSSHGHHKATWALLGCVVDE